VIPLIILQENNRYAPCALVLLVSMPWAGQAAACFETAATFKPRLDDYNQEISVERAMNYGKAVGFVQGVHDSFRNVGLVCTSVHTTVGDMMTVVTRHWKAAMDAMDALPSQTCASEIVGIILTKRFPCPESEAGPPAK
jgi:Rap1a immunity proteins